jgi:hypothetical protein
MAIPKYFEKTCKCETVGWLIEFSSAFTVVRFTFNAAATSFSYKLLWVPSQYGLFPECLHLQSHASLFSSVLNITGVNSVPVWEPSQKGWFSLLPHAHQKYVPGSRVTIFGLFAAIFGPAII